MSKRSAIDMKNQKGFTLIEIAIVMVIMGLLLGLGIPMMRTLIQSNELTEDRLAVKEAKDALIGYATANSKLPPPETGYLLPYQMLGVRSKDSHGGRLIYDVNSSLTSAANTSSFCSRLKSLKGRPKIAGVPVAFIVISKGANYKLDRLNNRANGTYENQSHPYNKQTADDIVMQESPFALRQSLSCP